MIDRIKAVPMADVLSRLGVDTYKKGNWEFWIIEWNDKTNWRSFNEKDNLINDFSGKGRASGSVIDVVMYFMSCDNGEAMKRLQQEFLYLKKPQTNIFGTLQQLPKQWIDYLTRRGINIEKVKNFVKRDNWIAVWLYKRSIIVWVSIRNLTDDKKKRFRTTIGTDWEAVYQFLINKDKKDLFVVEGMFDFLTLRQRTENVIGLRSAESWYEEIMRYKNTHNIILIPHNDIAGQRMRERFVWLDHNVFDLSEYGYKDLNDLYCDTQPWEWIIDAIMDNAKPQSKIGKLFEDLAVIQEKLKKDGILWVSSPFPIIDKQTSWLIPGKVYTLWASSNTGKTKLAYVYTCHFLRRWKKVLFINLEVDPVFCLKDIVVCMESKRQYEIDFKKVDQTPYKNLDIQNIFDLEDIEKEIKSSDAEIVFIDFIQNILSRWWSAYEKMATVSKKLQQIAIESNKIVFGLSQLSNETIKDVGKSNTDYVNMKWAGEITASSDVVFLLYSEWYDDRLTLKIIKNKFGKRWTEYLLWVDLSIGKFEMIGENTSTF